MKKDSGMCVLPFYISFIIKCMWKNVSGMWGLIPFMEYLTGIPKVGHLKMVNRDS